MAEGTETPETLQMKQATSSPLIALMISAAFVSVRVHKIGQEEGAL